MEMALSWKPGTVCMTREGLTLFELGSDLDFSNIYIMYNTGERSEPEKKKIKTTFGPPLLPIKYPHKTPPLTNLRGGGRTPGPPSGSAHDMHRFTHDMHTLHIYKICVRVWGNVFYMSYLIFWSSG